MCGNEKNVIYSALHLRQSIHHSRQPIAWGSGAINLSLAYLSNRSGH